jgi:CheY-like chemotaxis protein
MTSTPTVLVVEDDRDIREIVIETLTDEGYRTVGATNGSDALEQLRRGQPLPTVILLDIMMPVMDGRSFRSAQLADPLLAAIPIVVMTADANVAAISAELRANFHLKKPVSIEQLFAAVRRFCGPPRPPA